MESDSEANFEADSDASRQASEANSAANTEANLDADSESNSVANLDAIQRGTFQGGFSCKSCLTIENLNFLNPVETPRSSNQIVKFISKFEIPGF